MARIIPTTDWQASGCIDPTTGVATLRCIPVVMQNVINFLVLFAGIICVFLIVYSGYKIVSSEGDPEKLKIARKTLAYAIVGFLFVLISFWVIGIIGKYTGVQQLIPKP